MFSSLFISSHLNFNQEFSFAFYILHVDHFYGPDTSK